MPAVHDGQQFEDMARRWHALAERRLAHYDELYRSGRWRHYYASQEQFAARMLDVIRATKIWAGLAAKRPAAKTSHAPTHSNGLRPAA